MEMQILLNIQQGQFHPTRRQITFKTGGHVVSPIHHAFFRNFTGNQTFRQTQDDKAIEGNATDNVYYLTYYISFNIYF